MTELKYGKAIKKLDEIIAKIEGEEIDVDELAEKVKEAVGLIRVCKDRLEKAEMEVKQAVEDFEKDEKGA